MELYHSKGEVISYLQAAIFFVDVIEGQKRGAHVVRKQVTIVIPIPVMPQDNYLPLSVSMGQSYRLLQHR